MFAVNRMSPKGSTSSLATSSLPQVDQKAKSKRMVCGELQTVLECLDRAVYIQPVGIALQQTIQLAGYNGTGKP